MKRLHVLTAVAMCIACVIPLVGCSNKTESSTPIPAKAEPSSINASLSVTVSPSSLSDGSTAVMIHDADDMVSLADFEDLPKPTEFGEQLSYIYGYATMATALRTLSQGEGIHTNVGYILKGVLDAGNGAGSFFTDEETSTLFSKFQALVMETLHAKISELASRNLALAQEFLAKNSVAEGVHETASGLQYKVLVEGTGAKPIDTDTVTVDYQITLLNGTIIDSTYIRGSSDTFNISWLVVEGFKEGLQLMPVGSKYRFWLSPDLGYGASGGPVIEPNSLLIIDVELKGIGE